MKQIEDFKKIKEKYSIFLKNNRTTLNSPVDYLESFFYDLDWSFDPKIYQDPKIANQVIEMMLMIPNKDIAFAKFSHNNIKFLTGGLPYTITGIVDNSLKYSNIETYKKLRLGKYELYGSLLFDFFKVGAVFIEGISFLLGSFYVINDIFIKGFLLPRLQKRTEKKMFEDLISPQIIKDTSLNDLIGYQEIKEKLIYLSEQIKSQKQILTRISSVLLYGEPGTGKTHAVKALAGSCGIPLFIITIDKLVNEQGSIDQRINYLFEQAKKIAHCIIFFDDIDLLLGSRFGDSNKRNLSTNEKIALNTFSKIRRNFKIKRCVGHRKH